MPAESTRFDRSVGRYVHLDLGGVTHRVYFEEAGEGLPLLLQHTAGADGRQWRHVLEDEDLGARFRMIAYDLPYHGKSLPPTDDRWWEREYRLEKSFLMSVPLALCDALGLDRPVFMGSSIGGHLAVDLALHHPERFRAVVGLEAAMHTPGGWDDMWHHPRISNEFKASVMYGLTSPTSPTAHRKETWWVYSQGAPPVFKGDLYYYSVDHDLRETAQLVDTSKVEVHVRSGEYDWSGTPDLGRELAEAIPGATFAVMKGLGHFPMSEDPARFLGEIRPLLHGIAERTGRPPQNTTVAGADSRAGPPASRTT